MSYFRVLKDHKDGILFTFRAMLKVLHWHWFSLQSAVYIHLLVAVHSAGMHTESGWIIFTREKHFLVGICSVILLFDFNVLALSMLLTNWVLLS